MDNIGTPMASVAKLVGQRVGRARRGHGTMVTIAFLECLGLVSTHQRWSLWVRWAAWRIEQDSALIVACNDDEPTIGDGLGILNGARVEAVELAAAFSDAVFKFERGLVLRLFDTTTAGEDMESWLLYMPNNMVLVVGPGNRWVQQRSDVP